MPYGRFFQIAEKRRAYKEALEDEEDDEVPTFGANPLDQKNTVRQRRQWSNDRKMIWLKESSFSRRQKRGVLSDKKE